MPNPLKNQNIDWAVEQFGQSRKENKKPLKPKQKEKIEQKIDFGIEQYGQSKSRYDAYLQSLSGYLAEGTEKEGAAGRRSPASNSEQTDWEQVEQLLSPEFYNQLLGNDTAEWDQGGLEAAALVSPEFFNQLLENATETVNQKKKDIRDYNWDFLLHGNPDYQPQPNPFGDGTAFGGDLAAQNAGFAIAELYQSYMDGRKEKQQALNEAQQEANQITYAKDMYEISQMTTQEKNALGLYKARKDAAWVNRVSGMSDSTYEDEQRVLEAFGGRYDIKQINALAETYGRYQNEQIMGDVQAMGEQQGHGGVWTKVGASAATVPVNVVGKTASFFSHAMDFANGTGRYSGFDPNSIGGVFSTYSDNVRGAVAEDIRGDGESFWRNLGAIGYQGGMEGLDSLLSGVLYGDLDPFVSAVGNFGDTITDASKRGASYGDALMLAAANTAIDVGAEKISMDKLADSNLLRSTLKGMGIEVTKEEAKLVASKLADATIMQNNSDFNRRIALEMQEGKTYEEAHTAASKAFLEEVLETAFSSTLSGGVEGFFKGLSNKQKAQGLDAPQGSNAQQGQDVQQGEVRGEADRTTDGRTLEESYQLVDDYTRLLREDQADEIAKKLRYGDEFEQLKESLGENAPKSLEEFRDLKYSSGDWEQFQSYQRSIESGKLSAMADFDLYQKTSGDIDGTLVGVNTSNGIQIKSKSEAFIAGTIGSVDERRSGIDIKDIYAALTDPNAKVYPARIGANGNVSQRFKLGTVEVFLNPKTGNLIYVKS